MRESVLKLDVGDFTKPIRVQSGFLIVFLKDKKISVDDFNPELERKKLIDVQINEQLNQFSNIYFNKIKKNLTINEL